VRFLRLRTRRSEQSMPIAANPAPKHGDLQISGDFLGGDTHLDRGSGLADAGHHRSVFLLLTFPACPIPFDSLSPLRLPTMTIPDELRRAVVYQVVELHKPVAVVAAELRISLRSAERFLLYQRVHGDIHPHMNTRGVHEDNVRKHACIRGAVCAAVEAYPEAFLDEATVFVNEVQELMEEDVRVSPESVRRILAANGITRKVIETNFRQRNEAARAAWVAAQWVIPLECRVYIDEAHRRGQAANRRWAWALRGARAEGYIDASKGVATSFIVAMTHGGLVDWKLTKPPPGQSSVDFLLFLINLVLPAMNEYNPALPWDEQQPNCVLILDNARVHDHAAVAVLEAAGVMVCFLPPYSPDFNPVEDVFSVWSSWLRRHVTLGQFSAWPFSTLTSMLLHITPEMCAGFVKAAIRRYATYAPE